MEVKQIILEADAALYARGARAANVAWKATVAQVESLEEVTARVEAAIAGGRFRPKRPWRQAWSRWRAKAERWYAQKVAIYWQTLSQ